MQEFVESFGMIREDPALDKELSLKFDPKLVIWHGLGHGSSPVAVGGFQVVGPILLQMHLAYENENCFSVHGSAVLVAPGVALCAKHVIEDYVQSMHRRKFSGMCVALTTVGVQFWRLKTVTLVEGADLAVIGLIFASDLPPLNVFPVATISTKIPKENDIVHILGFRADAYTFDFPERETGRVTNIRYQGNVFQSSGQVTQVFPNGRDRYMLPGPSIEVTCTTFSGMSGGPVFNSQGFLIGLLSSSFEESPSYVSLLEPALTTVYAGGWPQSWYQHHYKLVDVINDIPGYNPLKT